MPLFALANAGIVLDAERARRRGVDSPVTLGIAPGSSSARCVGITLFVVLALRFGLGTAARRPDARQLVPASRVVAGIGFTVSLFVAELSFAGPLLADAKVGMLVASLVAAVAGRSLDRDRARTIRE